MSSPTIVITGATGGIGLHTALGVAAHDSKPHVVLTGRDQARGEEAVERVKQASGNPNISLMLGDLSDQGSLNDLAQRLVQQHPRIDVLINNAGMLSTQLKHNAQGAELCFYVNVVAPYALTQALLPALKAAEHARVLNITGGLMTDRIDPQDMQAQKGYVALSSYSHTKRLMEAMSLWQSRALDPSEVSVHVIYPGAASTSMTQAMSFKSLPWWMRPFWPVFSMFMQRDDDGKSAAKAARSSIWAAFAPELRQTTGHYYDTKCRRKSLNSSVLDETNQALVMKEIERFYVPPNA